MSNYDTLVRFVRAHAKDPLGLAKVINAWEWASLAGGSYGPTPSSAENVPVVLAASCGWRQVLMADLFKQIGIESRAVNFYNVPFQGNHTAIELLIHGKWMFFDPTFGTYFERAGGGAPLSAAEVRSLWPKVVVKKSNLEGWQGKFIDLSKINPAKVYSTYKDDYFYRPKAAIDVPFVLSGEIKSLYLGPKATYFVEGINTDLPASGARWVTRVDKSDKYSWEQYVDTYDAAGRRDSRWGVYDITSKTHYAWFIDWDQDGRYDWASKTTYIGNTRNAVFDYTVVVNDDKTKTIIDYDTLPYKADWSEKTSHYSATGALDWQTGIFDDGRSWRTDWDQTNIHVWKHYTDTYDSGGRILATTFVNDDGSIDTVDWSTVPGQNGTSGSNVLNGSPGRDFLQGLAGNDVLIGGGGQDRLDGGAGNDIYYVNSLNDLVVERVKGGTDTVRSNGSYVLPENVENLVLLSGTHGTGNVGKNYIAGNDSANVLSGLSGNDHLSGQAGDDRLSGGIGRDILEGGAGADTLSGGAGADVFIWRNVSETGTMGATSDLVRDFSRTAGDILNFAGIDANELAVGNQAFTFVGQGPFTGPGQIRYIQTAGETRLFLNTDQDSSPEAVIRLSGLKVPDASWFVL